MSMSSPSVTLDQALQGCPATFRAKLVNAYLELKKNHLESRYEAAGLSAGKFCEISLRLLQHEVLRSEEHTSELQSRGHLVCRLLLEKKKHVGHGDEAKHSS